jgi:hypothetical protein
MKDNTCPPAPRVPLPTYHPPTAESAAHTQPPHYKTPAHPQPRAMSNPHDDVPFAKVMAAELCCEVASLVMEVELYQANRTRDADMEKDIDSKVRQMKASASRLNTLHDYIGNNINIQISSSISLTTDAIDTTVQELCQPDRNAESNDPLCRTLLCRCAALKQHLDAFLTVCNSQEPPWMREIARALARIEDKLTPPAAAPPAATPPNR